MILNQAQCLNNQYLNDQTDLEHLHGNLLKANRISWRLDASTKTKMDLFQEIHNLNESKMLLKANPNRRRRSLVTKLKAGVCPIQVELRRYKGTKREDRLCPVCDKIEIEDERHFLFKCKPLKPVRKPYIRKFKAETGLKCKNDWVECLKIMINNDHLKDFAVWLEEMYLARRALVYRS